MTNGTIQNKLKSIVSLNESATTFKATSVAAAGKFETYHHPLKVKKHNCSHVSCSQIGASQSFTNEILMMKFCG